MRKENLPFVGETDTMIYMLEPKAKDAMDDADVLAKRDVAVKWCRMASDHASSYGGKPWQYVLNIYPKTSWTVTALPRAGQRDASRYPEQPAQHLTSRDRDPSLG